MGRLFKCLFAFSNASVGSWAFSARKICIFYPTNACTRVIPQVYDTSGMSCSNGGSVSVNIAHSTGSVPDGTLYGTHVSEVDSSDGGQFEHTVTDLTPGNVSDTTFCLAYKTKRRILS